MKNKIVITGGQGFIGNHLLNMLIDKYPDREFIAIDRKETIIQTINSSQHIIHNTKSNKNLTIYKTDINKWLPEVDDVDVVVHLAALPSVRDSDKNVERVIEDNILATQKIIDKCIDSWKPSRLIITSSSSVYNGDHNWPMKSSDDVRPLSPYAVSKLTNELTLQMYKNNGKLGNIQGIVIRPFTVFGPNQRDELCIQAIIDAFIKDEVFTLYGSGEQKRDFCYIDDTCSAIEALMFTPNLKHFIYNIGTGKNISINEVITKIGRIFNKPLKIKYEPPTIYDCMYTKADISHMKEDCNWEPKMDFDRGLMEQIKFQCMESKYPDYSGFELK